MDQEHNLIFEALKAANRLNAVPWPRSAGHPPSAPLPEDRSGFGQPRILTITQKTSKSDSLTFGFLAVIFPRKSFSPNHQRGDQRTPSKFQPSKRGLSKRKPKGFLATKGSFWGRWELKWRSPPPLLVIGAGCDSCGAEGPREILRVGSAWCVPHRSVVPHRILSSPSFFSTPCHFSF